MSGGGQGDCFPVVAHMLSLRSLLIHIHAGTRWTVRTGPAPPRSANEPLAGGEMEVKCLGNSN